MTRPTGIASDPAGLELKRLLAAELERRGIVVRAFGTGTALDILEAFLSAGFEGGRHATRVAKLGAAP